MRHGGMGQQARRGEHGGYYPVLTNSTFTAWWKEERVTWMNLDVADSLALTAELLEAFAT